MLAHQVGIEPDRAAGVLDLAAVGVVNNAWRNGPVEDWHAGDGPLNDGDMLRINAHTSWRIRQIIRRWRYEVGLPADADAGQLDDVSVDDWDWLAVPVWRWLVNPQRLLPGGFRLIEIAGNDLADYNEHVAGTLGAWATTAEKRGGRYAAWRAATHGGGWRAAVGGARRVGPTLSTPSLRSLTSRLIGTGVLTASGVAACGRNLCRCKTAVGYGNSYCARRGFWTRQLPNGSSLRGSAICCLPWHRCTPVPTSGAALHDPASGGFHCGMRLPQPPRHGRGTAARSRLRPAGVADR